MHSGIQVEPNIRPSLRSGWNDLCRALPGERCTIAPVALRMADAANPVGPRHHRKTWRTDPGRQDDTIWPFADHARHWRAAFAHGFPPCEAPRADVTHVHRRPARVRDDRDTPLFLGPECAHYPSIPNFGKVEYFQRRALTQSWRVLPDRQRKGWWLSLVIPGRPRREPKIDVVARDAARWIPGSMIRIAPQ